MRTRDTLLLVALLLFCLVAAIILWYLWPTASESDGIDMVHNPVGTRRALIEQAYPSFAAFENQSSFAGQSVSYIEREGDWYFAYLVHGSGLPIAQGTCFRVDRAGRVFRIGEFPDPLDSYAGYPAVDPMTCKGLRPKGDGYAPG